MSYIDAALTVGSSHSEHGFTILGECAGILEQQPDGSFRRITPEDWRSREIARLRTFLEVIASGQGDPQVIARQALGSDASPSPATGTPPEPR